MQNRVRTYQVWILFYIALVFHVFVYSYGVQMIYSGQRETGRPLAGLSFAFIVLAAFLMGCLITRFVSKISEKNLSQFPLGLILGLMALLLVYFGGVIVVWSGIPLFFFLSLLFLLVSIIEHFFNRGFHTDKI